MSDPKLKLSSLVKIYGDHLVLDRFEMQVAPGELVTMVGPSGCGKSTVLNIVAGLVEPTSGDVLLDGRAVSQPGPDRGMVFQSYSLYPWRTVSENVAFGLELQGLPKKEIAERVARFLTAMGLTKCADELPRALSGGMKQRAAIARALAAGPEILLLDEPFGALDSQTRSSMQEFLLAAWREPESCNTIVLVTHDVDEAVYLSERILILSANPGRVVEEIVVPFGRDRTQALVDEARFHETVRRVRDRLKHWSRRAQPEESSA